MSKDNTPRGKRTQSASQRGKAAKAIDMNTLELLPRDLRSEIIDQVRDGTLRPHQLLTIGADPKTIKGEIRHVRTAILYGTPHTGSSIANDCPYASKACADACLNTAGRGDPRMGTSVQRARLIRSVFFHSHREEFMRALIAEIERFLRHCERVSMRPAVRLNGTTDTPWESIRFQGQNIMSHFEEDVTFYDYTKWPISRRPDHKLPPNYHLTFSRSEENHNEAMHNLAMGRNVAVVFSTKKKHDLPKTWMGYKVIDGDVHDLTFLDRQPDEEPIIRGLRAKGRARYDTSGFVVRT